MSHETRPDLLPKTLDEALGRLVEEMHEAGVEIGHIMRFGYLAKDRSTGKVYNNGQALIAELIDVQDAIERFRAFYYNRNFMVPINHGNVNPKCEKPNCVSRNVTAIKPKDNTKWTV